jgi:hypothetical protein
VVFCGQQLFRRQNAGVRQQQLKRNQLSFGVLQNSRKFVDYCEQFLPAECHICGFRC